MSSGTDRIGLNRRRRHTAARRSRSSDCTSPTKASRSNGRQLAGQRDPEHPQDVVLVVGVVEERRLVVIADGGDDLGARGQPAVECAWLARRAASVRKADAAADVSNEKCETLMLARLRPRDVASASITPRSRPDGPASADLDSKTQNRAGQGLQLPARPL